MEAIAKGQITISILDKGDKGNDAEFYKLNPLIELAAVDKDGKLGVSLKYNIQHIVGANITNINAGTYYVRFRPNIATVNTNLSTNTTTPFYNNASYQTDYYKQSSKITYFIIELIKGEQILDSRIVTVTLLPSATFEIKQATDKEVASIKSRITANETKIANNVKQITNNYSTLNQKADSIESRVGKIEVSSKNIINDKQFFIHSDNQPHQSKEYDTITDTYIFKCTDKNNDIDFGSDFIRLDAGKYILSFTPSFNGDDVRLDLLLNLYTENNYNSDKIYHKVIKYSDIPESKLYTYQFTVTEDKPYLMLYLESEAQPAQVTLPWIIKLHNIRLLKISESEAVIKQQADELNLQVNKAGINLKDGQIVATSNNFRVINESGQPTFEIDSKGNLIGSGSARFQGCVSYGKTIITKENFDYYIQKGSYSGLRLDRLMPRIQIGNNEEPVGGTRTYLPQQSLALPQMFISTVDGDAITGGMSLGLKKSEWNEICRGFAGNYFYIYNKINPKYPANTISIYGDIAGMPLSYTSYIDIKSGQFLVLKCEIGIEKKSTQECLVWKYVNLGKISI